MQLSLDLPTPRQVKPRPDRERLTFLAAHARKQARIDRLHRPTDHLAFRLAVSLFHHGHEVSDIDERLQQSPAARRWLAACHQLGIVRFRVCPYFNKRLWKAA